MKLFSIVTFVFLAVPCAATQASPAPSSSPDEAEIVSSNNAFAIELYKQLHSQHGNIVFSPAGVMAALAMAYAGARGDTAAELAQAFHVTLPQERLHPAMGALLREYGAAADAHKPRLANALWLQQGLSNCIFWGRREPGVGCTESLKLIRDNYDGGLQMVDFNGPGGSLEASRRINNWAEAQSDSQIGGLIPEGEYFKYTRLVLASITNFNYELQSKFTNTMEFSLSKTRGIKGITMISPASVVSYYQEPGFKAVAIPDRNNDCSLVLFLPDETDGLPAFERSLTPEKMRVWLDRLSLGKSNSEMTYVTLPAFKVTGNYDLVDVLKAVGVHRAFDQHEADFSGVVPSGTAMLAGNGLFLSAVLHKVSIQVGAAGRNDSGDRALRADHRAGRAMPQLTSFPAGHPFLFLVRNNRSGAILFMGRVVDPSK